MCKEKSDFHDMLGWQSKYSFVFNVVIFNM